MRKLFLTAFLLFYGYSVLAHAMARTEAWASERASDFARQRSSPGPGIAEAGKHSQHPFQTKVLEDGWVLILPEVASSELPHFDQISYHRSAGFISGSNSRAISSRAPPVLL